MARDDLDRAQDEFQEEAGDTVEKAGNVMEETWEEVKKPFTDDEN